MGKALIFSGVIIDNPLQTVTFKKELITASDYVSAYKEAVGSLTSKQESSLLTFVENLMANDIWDKVNYFFPLIKGTDYQAYNLKSIKNIGFIARTPSYNSEKDCLHIGYDGLAMCTTADIELDINNMTSIISYAGSCNFFAPVSLGINNRQDDYIRFGGNQIVEGNYWLRHYPTIKTSSETVGIKNSGSSNAWFSSSSIDNILVSLSITSSTKASSTVYSIEGGKKFEADDISVDFHESYRDLDKFPLKLGGYYGVESSSQPVEVDLYCIFLADKLSDSELAIATKAVNQFNNDLGRYTGELVE